MTNRKDIHPIVMKVLDELSERYFIHKRPTIKKSDNLEWGWRGRKGRNTTTRARITAWILVSTVTVLACTAKETTAPINVASVFILERNSFLQAGHTLQLNAIVTGSDGKVLTGRTVTWRSSNTSVATVSPDGLVLGLQPSAVVISATSEGRMGETTLTVWAHPRWIRDSVWNEDNTGMTLVYESEIGGLRNSWKFKEVTDSLEAVRKGWKAQRFEVRPGDCYGTDCSRSPVYERNEFAQAGGENLEGDEYWYAWSFYVPLGTAASWVYFAQFQQHYNYDSIWMFLKRPGQPFCALLDPKKNQYWTCDGTRGSNPLINDTNFAGRWHDIMVHAKWSVNSDGFTKIYVDGRLVVNYQGYTRTFGNDDIYFKYGIYRHASNVSTVIYYDEIRRGKNREDVEIH